MTYLLYVVSGHPDQIVCKQLYSLMVSIYASVSAPIFTPLMQPRHHLPDATGVVSPDEADLGGALAEGLEAH